MDNAVALAAIGLVGTLLAVVVKPLFTLLKENTKATEALVHETKKGNQQSAERNGHLGELIIQQGKHTEVIAKKSVKAILDSVQKVNIQEVQHQHIQETTKEEK